MTNPRQSNTRSHSRAARAKKRANEDPKMIGQWKIGKTIGKGSSGRVKVARHTKTNQYAAIKIVSKNALVNSRMSMSDAPAHAEKVLLGIEREIVIMKLIDHPNVLNLYDVWETRNELYLIMEYVEGGELFDYLVSRGRLPVNEALHYFQQIISAVSYCHGFNIAHRDLKPENLLLSKSGSSRNIKVADFGMAAYTDPAAMLSTSCGSPHYASPEVVEGRAYKGNISDIWSCGVILYALLAGRLPFDDENLRVLLEKVKMAKYDMPSDIPASAQDLLARMLDRDVTRRITMSQILKHPFFLTATPPPLLLIEAQTPTLNQLSSSIDKPVQSEEDIDADIFDNLRTLWHGAPTKEIIENLLNDEKTWEKAVYHLLLKYRFKHLENYNMDEDDEDPHKHHTWQTEALPNPLLFDVVEVPEEKLPAPSRSCISNHLNGIAGCGDPKDQQEDPIPTRIARPSAPTPRKAVCSNDETTLEDDPEIFMSTPFRMRTISNPVSSQPVGKIDSDKDVFTVTPRSGARSANSGPQPLPLPTFNVVPVIGQASNLQKASPVEAEKMVANTNISSRVPSPCPISTLPAIDVPNLQDIDEAMQRFFHQIVERLNVMQMGQAPSSTHSAHSSVPSSSVIPGVHGNRNSRAVDAVKATLQRVDFEMTAPPPAPLMADELNPEDSRFEDAAEGTVDRPSLNGVDFTILGLGISSRDTQSRRNGPSPADVQRLPQNPHRPSPPTINGADVTQEPGKYTAVIDKGSRTSDKENMSVRKHDGRTSGGARKKSSLRHTQDGRKALGDRHVQIVLPSDETGEMAAKKRKSIVAARSTETSPGLPDGSPFLPEDSGSRRSWFGNLFHFKPASYNLLSVHDAYTTKEECARLLSTFGVSILANSEATGILKCKLEEVKDPVGVVMAKAIRFRMEVHSVTNAHSIAGYVTQLTMVQEKGALSTFRLVYNRLRREWVLDTKMRTPPGYGPLALSPAIISERSSPSV